MSQYNNYYSNQAEGGYVQSPFGSPGGAPRRQGAQHALRPVLIQDLLNATQVHADAEFKIDDVEVGQITLVAQVIEIRNQATNCTYNLDDGYGRFEARHWSDSSGEDENPIKENTFVRVLGSLKSFGNKTYINTTHIRPIKDFNERSFHVLEALAVKLMLQRGPPGQPNGQTGIQNGHAHGISAYTAQKSTANGANDTWAHLPALQRKIIHFILAQNDRSQGISVSAIARGVGTADQDAQAISAALDSLMDDGHVYTTIDEMHFDVSA